MDKEYPIPLLVLDVSGRQRCGMSRSGACRAVLHPQAHWHILPSLSSQLMPIQRSAPEPETWVWSCKHEAL